MKEELHAYSIYQDPRTPGEFTVRKWIIEPAQREGLDAGEIGRAKTIEQARHLIPLSHWLLPEGPMELRSIENWIPRPVEENPYI